MRQARRTAIFCSFTWPRHPGHSGGEIRDYHLLRGLLDCAQVSFISLTRPEPDGRADLLRERVESLTYPEAVPAHLMNFSSPGRFFDRLHGWFYRRGLPFPFASYHAEVAGFAYQSRAYLQPELRQQVEKKAPDFLFVSPQHNPIAMQLGKVLAKTRTILATYDVESVRVASMKGGPVGHLEAQLAEKYERRNLACYDGLIAVSELDKQTFIERYGFDARRILVLENSVDVDYFDFRPRMVGQDVIFVGNLAYLPNAQAARRLLVEIMPRVRMVFPQARGLAVGQNPAPELLALADGEKNIVTGRVDDVRPYLEKAAAACIPLEAGSGTKFKVLEALSAGVPTVCSPIALEGLNFSPREHLLFADSHELLADALVSVLRDPAAYTAMSLAARRQVEAAYSWDAVLQKLAPWLDEIRELPLQRRF